MEQITLDLIPSGILPVVHASQYDEGRQWRVNLTDNGTAYTLSTEEITLKVRKGDGTAVTTAVTVVSGKTYVDLATTEQMTAVAFENMAELHIEKDGAHIGTLNFIIKVEPDNLYGDRKSHTEIHDLAHQVDECVTAELKTVGAKLTGYDNTESGLDATNAQDAIDELAQKPSVDAYTKQESDAFITDEYDAESTYSIGDMVIHENALYICSTAITTAEAWNSAHWTLTNIATAIGTVKTAIPTKTSDLQNDSGFAQIDDTTESASKTYSSEKIEKITNSLTEFPSDKYWSDNALKGKLYRTFEGIATTFDVASLKPTTENGKTYYIAPNGNDSNSGEDREHPLTKLSTAIGKADVETIIVTDGIYNLGRVGGSFTKGVNIVADENAKPIFVMSRDKTWAKTDGYTYIYQTTDTANTFYGVVKANARNSEGDLLYYTLVESLADVESTENSYYVSGHDIYIHSESAPTKTYVLVSGVNCHATLSNGETIYVEGCEFIGGNYGGFRITNGNASKKPLALFKNCGFSKSYMGNALYLQGCSGILQGCYASYASDDGFNYHATLDVVPDSIEINCIGRHNGTTGNNTNNGSTTHDGAKILRLNCEFYDNIGPNVADVNNSLSFNYGCVSHDSNGSTTNKSGFQCQGGVMWNDTCSAYGNLQNFQAYLGGTLYQHNCSGSVDLGSDGKARAY